ncbi:hypothetical protein Raf01_28250 [Rugosimonospora africana]|uniref:Uncharacterized protein n=1 Tax=Rugosimonospora africana TaxID=556532 RepID=A0A8J3VQS9_9ACTN|nr:hypothetical protein Raf01_28250 [Rugosimonospora africana]
MPVRQFVMQARQCRHTGATARLPDAALAGNRFSLGPGPTQRRTAPSTSVREDTPSLRRMLETCTAAVFGEM